MDLSMPTMGGIEASRQIFNLQASSEEDLCRIVALTAFTNASNIKEC